jgi:hypothetical protein
MWGTWAQTNPGARTNRTVAKNRGKEEQAFMQRHRLSRHALTVALMAVLALAAALPAGGAGRGPLPEPV